MKLIWADIRYLDGSKEAIIEEAIHQRVDAIVSDNLSDLAGLPPTVRKVLFPSRAHPPESPGGADIVILDEARHEERPTPPAALPGVEFAWFVEVVDADTLDVACRTAATAPLTVLFFRDPTKIPLEIVLAAAANSGGSIITVAGGVDEARVIFGVLEHGSDGVLVPVAAVGDITALTEAAAAQSPDLELTELEITQTTHVGMGDRACVDTCSYFRKDEGILVGSYSKGMVLCVSETHPLPYMPTRPFRVNAGAIHSYTLTENGRTRYLSELRSGARVLAVDTSGHTRPVTVGRVKIESRPLLSVDAIAPNGTVVNLILQDDWHVRVLGPGDAVLNSTELRQGDRVLGYLPAADRHVGYPISEFCIER